MSSIRKYSFFKRTGKFSFQPSFFKPLIPNISFSERMNMSNVRLLMVLLIAAAALFTEANAQGRYSIVGTTNDIVVMELPMDLKINVGDRFYVMRRKGVEELTLAIARVETFKGKFCRLRLTEKIMKDPPREGDYLVPYDPVKYTPWGDSFDTSEPAPAKPQPQPAFLEEQPSASQVGFLVAFFSGFGLSNFDGEEMYGVKSGFSQSSYIPLGGQFFVQAGQFHIGAEVNYAVAPFTFETENSSGRALWEDELEQLQFGALARFNFTQTPAKPYLRAGAGVYTGNFTRKFSDQYKKDFKNEFGVDLKDEKVNLDTNFGFNLGAGVAYRNGFIEFVYHFVERSYEETSTDQAGKEVKETVRVGADNWAVQVGVQFPL